MAEAATRPAPAPAAAAEPPDAKKRKKKDAHPRDPAREVIETIVFVVVLVLLLKLFVTEAFVIPTGSMAETLYGYQKIVTCPECGLEFPVNSHDEVEANPQTGQRHPVTGCVCPNCRFAINFSPVPGSHPPRLDSPPNRTGDRVLVLKPLYHLKKPARGDVVVFKYPKAPQELHTAQNYIKRAMAFGGETLGIHRGELFVTQALTYPEGDELYPRPDDPKDLWELRYTYQNNPKATELFEASRRAGFPSGTGGFEVVRKTDEQVLACRRVVWDNDRQPRELAGRVPPRWYAPPEAAGKWNAESAEQPRTFAHTADSFDWVRYRHLCWEIDPQTHAPVKPWTWSNPHTEPGAGPVDNFLGYNTAISAGVGGRASAADAMWVGDLIIECEAELGAGGEVTLELSKGQNRFRAKFAGGRVALSRIGPGEAEFGSWPCKVSGPGKYRLRFANVDCRLRVWVNDSVVPVGTAADYPHPEPAAGDEGKEGWTRENDIEAPASIGAKGAVTLRGVKLFRDIYYTRTGTDPAGADIFYVQPGHYMCLGDNSAQSSDSRSWGLVPERLMLGKAVFVFFPLGRVGFIK